MALSTYPNNPAALRAIGLRSTTQRLALNPASLLMACASSPRLASDADVGGEAELVQGAAHLGEVVAFVQAQPPRMVWAGCWQAVHRR